MPEVFKQIFFKVHSEREEGNHWGWGGAGGGDQSSVPSKNLPIMSGSREEGFIEGNMRLFEARLQA